MVEDGGHEDAEDVEGPAGALLIVEGAEGGQDRARNPYVRHGGDCRGTVGDSTSGDSTSTDSSSTETLLKPTTFSTPSRIKKAPAE